MTIGGGMVVAVGYAMVINMMASREVWPFFAIGFALAGVKDLTLIALGAIGLSLALIYLALEDKVSKVAQRKPLVLATRWATSLMTIRNQVRKER